MASLTVGDPIPWFTLPSSSNPNYHFDMVGGYRVVLFFFGSTRDDRSAQVVRDFCAMQSHFAAQDVPFFGVSIDPHDQVLAEAIVEPTYCKFLWDFERTVSQQYGVCTVSADEIAVSYTPTTFVLDENLHVLQVLPLEEPESYAAQVFAYVSSLPKLAPPTLAVRQAPVLFIPRVLDPEFCQTLIQLHEATDARDSGFMREVDGKTVEILDYGFKKRRDINLAETPLLDHMNQLVIRRVRPEIEKAYQFRITRFERHIVACYDAADRGFFNRHRDNTTKGTAHRRFAMTLNLNTDEYEGGCLRFPEYGTQLYRPAVGEAVIFSCSLLHEVTPVTSGRRFALLSFFYGDEDALVRERNRQYLADAPQPSKPEATASKATQSSGKMAGFQPKQGKKRR